MKQSTLPSGKYLLVDEIPKDAGGVEIPDFLMDGCQFITYCVKFGDEIEERDLCLPPGSYELVGKGDKIDEETWKGMVKGYIYSGKISFQAYYDYSEREPISMDDIFSTAVESGISWIKSHGMEPGNVVILKKLNK